MVQFKRYDALRTIATALALMSLSTGVLAREAPRLVLQITVDALRGDLPMRHLSQMGDGGFRYLLERGIHYENAHYSHANTETVVGHASLATGTASPRRRLSMKR